MPTVFENYITHTLHPPTGQTVELALWDTAGQEEYDRLRPLSYPETDLLFVCFAIDCPNSLENVMDKVNISPPLLHPPIPRPPYNPAGQPPPSPQIVSDSPPQWYPEVLHFCPTTPLILVGLKSDLRSKRTCIDLLKTQGLTPVTPAQGQAVAQRMGAIYVECSSKESRGVDEVFDLAITTAIRCQEGGAGEVGGGGYGKSGGGGNGGQLQALGGGGRQKVRRRGCKIL